MSSAGECTVELLVFPIIFQTISFHHRAAYEVRFSFSLPMVRLHPVQQFSAGDQQEQIDRNGNAWNVDGHAQARKHFRTSKFPIEYNDQIIKFKTGCIARLASQLQESVRIYVELIRLDQEKAKSKGYGKRVSSETLEVSLRGGEGENLRRIVFSTNQYISFLDVAFQFTLLRTPFALQERTETRQLYQRQVVERLQIYRELAEKTADKLEQFHLTKLNHPSFRHNYNISSAFEAQFSERQIADLSYVAVRLSQERPDQNIESHFSIQKYETIDSCAQTGGASNILCEYYQCEQDQLQDYIKSTGKLIQLNIRSLFERLVQLTICLLGQERHFIIGKQINRVKAFIAESQRNRDLDSAGKRKFSQELINAHKTKMKSFLCNLSNITGSQLKNPYVQVSNEPSGKESRKGTMEHTLTVFIHGYKGNQYDLSKIKSHLMMLLGCNHFYSIKGLSNDKANQSTIRQLAETAARELMAFLSLSPTFKSINFIGFSLGGVIVRAMLPWLQPHKSRFNLFLTIATPHLGLRELQSCLVRAGLCYMRRVAGIQSIRELNSERDATACRYLLELASGEGLEWFKTIILVGSFQDSYVPAYSALVQYSGDDEVTGEMARRLEKVMGRAVRVAVKLQYKQSILDAITRRRTHISFLEDDAFIKYLLVRMHHLFTHERHDR